MGLVVSGRAPRVDGVVGADHKSDVGGRKSGLASPSPHPVAPVFCRCYHRAQCSESTQRRGREPDPMANDPAFMPGGDWKEKSCEADGSIGLVWPVSLRCCLRWSCWRRPAVGAAQAAVRRRPQQGRLPRRAATSRSHAPATSSPPTRRPSPTTSPIWVEEQIFETLYTVNNDGIGRPPVPRHDVHALARQAHVDLHPEAGRQVLGRQAPDRRRTSPSPSTAPARARTGSATSTPPSRASPPRTRRRSWSRPSIRGPRSSPTVAVHQRHLPGELRRQVGERRSSSIPSAPARSCSSRGPRVSPSRSCATPTTGRPASPTSTA